MTQELRQQLFEHLSSEHDLILLETELDDILTISGVFKQSERIKELEQRISILDELLKERSV